MTMPPARFGLLLMIAGAAIDSTSGLFTRLIPADGFTIASGRGFAAFAFLFLLLLVQSGRQLPARLLGIGLWGLVFVTLNGVGMVMSVVSLSLTSVANFFMIFATAPFVAALGARIVLGERLDPATLLAALAGCLGIAVMMFTGVRTGALLGDALALGCVLAYSGLVLLMRRHQSLDILPTITLTVLASGLIALPLADFSAFGPREVGLLAVFGAVQLGLGNLLIFSAASRIPAAQSGLLGILNAGFAPLWVFLVLGEVPPAATLAGGAIILGAAVAHLVWALSRPVADGRPSGGAA